MIIGHFQSFMPHGVFRFASRVIPATPVLLDRISRLKSLADVDERFRLLDEFGECSISFRSPPPIEADRPPDIDARAGRLANDLAGESCRKYPTASRPFRSLPITTSRPRSRDRPRSSARRLRACRCSQRGRQAALRARVPAVVRPMVQHDLRSGHPMRAAQFSRYARRNIGGGNLVQVRLALRDTLYDAADYLEFLTSCPPEDRQSPHGRNDPVFLRQVYTWLPQISSARRAVTGGEDLKLKKRPADYYKMLYATRRLGVAADSLRPRLLRRRQVRVRQRRAVRFRTRARFCLRNCIAGGEWCWGFKGASGTQQIFSGNARNCLRDLIPSVIAGLDPAIHG